MDKASIKKRLLDPVPPLSRTTCTISGDLVTKSGPRVRLEEVEAFKTARSLGLPVPAVHDVRESTKGYGGMEFVMDLVPGLPLEEVWSEMTADMKTDIAQQLGRLISTMRSAAQSGEIRIGACGGGQARDSRRRTQYTGGPYTTESDFNNLVLDFYKATPVHIRQALAQSLTTDHRIMFIHADLSPRNIIVMDGKITGIIDWEVAGWYPEYWEYIKFFECVTNCKDWMNHADLVFETKYPKELASFQAIIRWQMP